MQKCQDCGNSYPESATLCPVCGCPSKIKDKRTEKEREVDLFLLDNRFPPYRYNEIRSWLMTLDDRQFLLIDDYKYKDPFIMTMISIFLGYIGVDRFVLEDIKKGLFKLLMFSCSFLVIPGVIALILWIKDIFNIKNLTQEYNYRLMKKAIDHL